MTMTVRQAFEKGTQTFNAHDIEGFAQILADDVIFAAPGGIQGKGMPASRSLGAGSKPSLMRALTSTPVTLSPISRWKRVHLQGPTKVSSTAPRGTCRRRAVVWR
jgi:hypothetical protein